MAVSRLLMSSEPGVKSLVRLTAARVAAFDERSWTLATRNGVLLERLPQELHDLLGACRLQLQEKCTNQRDGILTPPSGARNGGFTVPASHSSRSS